MSDFLSNFTKENYERQKRLAEEEYLRLLQQKKQRGQLTNSPKKEPAVNTTSIEKMEKTDDLPLQASIPSEAAETIVKSKSTDKEKAAEMLSNKKETRSKRNKRGNPPQEKESKEANYFGEEETETDPGYRKKQIIKYSIIAGSVVVLFLLGLFTYYKLNYIKVPQFIGEQVSEARSWAAENKIQLEIEQEYDFDIEVNQVISQDISGGERIKKGKTLKVTASLGADPEEAITLPDFASLSKDEAVQWIEANKADNATIIEEYHDEIESNKFIKTAFANKDVTVENYKRKDKLQIYYSKGKEELEKNIEVPDFNGKTKTEVTEWAQKNELKLETEAVYSETVAVDNVVSQETAPKTMVAKKDTFKIKVSKGKAIIVPNYSQFTFEEASSASGTIPTQIRQVFSQDIPYGQFISQSVAAGTEYADESSIPIVEVIYSYGRPYINDLRGQTEGELQRIFYEEFQSKGANVTYNVYYVDSAESKGTVVDMNKYAQFISLDENISIGVSKGNLTETE